MGRICVMLGALLAVLAWAEAAEAGSCEDLARTPPSDVRLVATRFVANAGFRPEGGAVPVKAGFCRVVGVIETEIGFELWLPEPDAWNRRFLVGGVGGQAGALNLRELVRGVERGYASASTDTGHKASDVRWLLGDPMRAQNYAHRANHLLAVKSREIIARYYQPRLEHAFFVGCSGGGRQALTELQRYPEDFDGIIAGAPGPKTPEMSARRMWEMIQHTRLAGLLTEADWKRVADAAIRHCDADDRVIDGVIGDPLACSFDPGSLRCRSTAASNCLSVTQVAEVRRIYAPLRDENGRKIDDGLLPGVLVSPVPAPEPFTPGPAYLATVLFGHGVHRDPNWSPSRFRIADDLPAVDRVMNLHADDPNIEAFRARGGKLILYQGWTDPLVSAHQTLDYHQAVEQALGARAAISFVRLFMAPGVGHCIGGAGPDLFGGAGGDAPIPDHDHDLLSALERWVDTGQAPERVIASKLREGKLVQTRPLCAWPAAARYSGGDPDDAASFICATPGAAAEASRIPSRNGG